MDNLILKSSGVKTFGSVEAHGPFRLHQGDKYTVNVSNYIDHRSRLLGSLHFPEINARMTSVSTAHGRTYEWLFLYPESHPDWRLRESSQWDNFHGWLKDGSGTYVVEGKAGSGKSTLMKFIYNHQQTRPLIAQQSRASLPLVLYHCFWLAGTELQRMYKGMLLTLVAQALEPLPAPISHGFASQKEYISKRGVLDWSEQALQCLLIKVLQLRSDRHLILLDGLDEFDHNDRPSRLVSFIRELQHNCPNILICVSSRPTAWLEQHFGSSSKLRLQDLTRTDIKSYTAEVLEEEFAFYANDIKAYELDEIQHLVAEKAEGVFLWVKYALHSLSVGFEALDSIKELKARLICLPTGMTELYEHMWRRYENANDRHRREAAKFLWCLRILPYHRLTVFELVVVFDPVLLQYYQRSIEPHSMKELLEKCTVMMRKLMIRTAGLLVIGPEAVPLPYTHVQLLRKDDRLDEVLRKEVSYLHRSAYDFLFETDFGISITKLELKEVQDLGSRSLISQLASCVQQNRPSSMGCIFDICRSIGELEHTVKLCQAHYDAVSNIGNSLDKIVDSCIRLSPLECGFGPDLRLNAHTQLPCRDSRSWFHAWRAYHSVTDSFAPEILLYDDFASQVLYHGGFGSLTSFLSARNPSPAYFTYLLSRTMARLVSHQAAGDSKLMSVSTWIKGYLDILHWLLEAGASLTKKCEVRMLLKVHPGQGFYDHPIMLSALDILSSAGSGVFVARDGPNFMANLAAVWTSIHKYIPDAATISMFTNSHGKYKLNIDSYCLDMTDVCMVFLDVPVETACLATGLPRTQTCPEASFVTTGLHEAKRPRIDLCAIAAYLDIVAFEDCKRCESPSASPIGVAIASTHRRKGLNASTLQYIIPKIANYETVVFRSDTFHTICPDDSILEDFMKGVDCDMVSSLQCLKCRGILLPPEDSFGPPILSGPETLSGAKSSTEPPPAIHYSSSIGTAKNPRSRSAAQDASTAHEIDAPPDQSTCSSIPPPGESSGLHKSGQNSASGPSWPREVKRPWADAP